MKELKLEPWIFGTAKENEVEVFANGVITGEYGPEVEVLIFLTSHTGEEMWARVDIEAGGETITKTLPGLAEALNYIETLCPEEIFELFEEAEE